jgi:hypothetical protein
MAKSTATKQNRIRPIPPQWRALMSHSSAQGVDQIADPPIADAQVVVYHPVHIFPGARHLAFGVG